MLDEILENPVWEEVEKSISCGHCGKATTVESPFNCRCGRYLCEDCGKRWGWCKDHAPVCNHLYLVPTQWNRKKPEPVKMIGSCVHNMTCPVCGYGWVTVPCPCERIEKEFVIDWSDVHFLMGRVEAGP